MYHEPDRRQVLSGLTIGHVVRMTLSVDAFRAMFVTLASGLVVMLVDPILIFWLDLRLDGAAMGVWVSRICMASIALWLAIGKHNLLARHNPVHINASLASFSMIAGSAILT